LASADGISEPVQPAEIHGVEPLDRESEDTLLHVAGPVLTWGDGHAENPVPFLLIASQASTSRSVCCVVKSPTPSICS
jgi:hypothetical protein